MAGDEGPKIAIVYPGDRTVRRQATAANNRFANLFRAFQTAGARVEPAVYHDDFCGEVRAQLLQVDGALVWSNPIEGGRTRAALDAMLRDVAAAGVFVSTHPDVILTLGTKSVLASTREVGWGADVRLYRTPGELRTALAGAVAAGQVRVLKQNRGHSGIGIWKVEAFDGPAARALGAAPPLRVRHAQRGSTEEVIAFDAFVERCAPYFSDGSVVIDQAYQSRLPEGMIRCYLTHDRVNGFGHQAVNALCPAPPGVPAAQAPQPGPRLYHPPSLPEFQGLRLQLEREWLPALQRVLGLGTHDLPVLWDCDFLLGPKTADGRDSYVLCEINVSSVAPYPESAVPAIVEATLERLRARGRPGA